MTSNVFYFIMNSLTMSRLNCFRLVKIETKKERHEIPFQLLSLWLSLNETDVFLFSESSFSYTANSSLIFSLDSHRFASLLVMMMMSFACLLKLCPCCWNYLQAKIESGFFVAFLWLFNLRLNVVSTFLA